MSLLAVALPCPTFRRLPALQRRFKASRYLDLFQRLKRAHSAEGAPLAGGLRELISWASIGQDIERAIEAWRRELHRAQNAARSAVAMGQGRPALALAGGPGRQVSALHPETAAPTLTRSCPEAAQ